MSDQDYFKTRFASQCTQETAEDLPRCLAEMQDRMPRKTSKKPVSALVLVNNVAAATSGPSFQCFSVQLNLLSFLLFLLQPSSLALVLHFFTS